METLAIFKKYLQDESLVLKLNSDWGSNSGNHRNQIKEQIPKNGFTSVSHCPSLGGFAASTSFPIGFDVEETKRVQVETVARISTENESQMAPSPGLLWAAKEACFKALQGPDQPQVVSHIQINGWQGLVSNQDNQIFQFHAQKNNNSMISDSWGIAIQSPTHVLAIFLLRK